jgi:4-phosphopantoate--beta-alanine ligase
MTENIDKKEFIIPKSHPRFRSLKLRETLVTGVETGITSKEGLIAHGRGEAFDYLLGEVTIPPADYAAKVTAAQLILAKNPVISVNGNVAALAVKEIIELSKTLPAKIEVNIFHYSKSRFSAILNKFRESGADKILGENRNKKIPGLEHSRAACTEQGIYTSDIVLVPLEDGDRASALKKMGKKVITIDLNPLSRTAKTCDVTIVDNLIRAIPNITSYVHELRDYEKTKLIGLIHSYDNSNNLKECLNHISTRLKYLDV